jgi:hypothetical protein
MTAMIACSLLRAPEPAPPRERLIRSLAYYNESGARGERPRGVGNEILPLARVPQ